MQILILVALFLITHYTIAKIVKNSLLFSPTQFPGLPSKTQPIPNRGYIAVTI